MSSKKEQMVTDRPLLENLKRYRELNGHEPYFSLSPEGARRLIEVLANSGVNLRESHEVDVKILIKGLFQRECINIELDSSHISTLLGPVSSGYLYNKVFIDPEALNAVASLNGAFREQRFQRTR